MYVQIYAVLGGIRPLQDAKPCLPDTALQFNAVVQVTSSVQQGRDIVRKTRSGA